LPAPEPGLAVGQADPVVAALMEKRSVLAADLAVAEDAVTCLRRQIMALSETLKTFGHLEPERDRLPAAVRHKHSKEGVHGVRADHQRFCAGVLQPPCCLGYHRRGTFPVAGVLERRHLSEVERLQHQLRRVEPAEPIARDLIEMAIVDGGTLPAHAADQPKSLHRHQPRTWS